MSETDFFAHDTAIVETPAFIGSGTKIWHHCHVRRGASIGRDCIIGKNVYVDAEAVIGSRVKIQNNVSIYNGVTIEDDVFVGPSATFTNDLVPRAFNSDWKITPTHVRTGASIGANATIVCGNSIGEFAMVAAGSTVTHDVEANQLVAGTPARHLGWVCTCGRVISRNGERPELCLCQDCQRRGHEQ